MKSPKTMPVDRFDTPETAQFWKAAQKKELRMPKCVDCGTIIFPPAAFCRNCLSERIHWEELSGEGKIVSWVVFHALSGIKVEAQSYAVVLIELDEGPRLISQLLDEDPKKIKQGARVHVVFANKNGRMQPYFRVV